MLAMTTLCLAALVQPGPGRPDVLRGIVIEKGTGRPMARVSLRLSDEAGAPTATTDERGRFDGLPTGRANVVPSDGQPGPPARVRAADDRAWPWEFIEPEGPPNAAPGFWRTKAIEDLYRQAETRWSGDGPGAELVVECPPVGTVEAVVRGPDGFPLADRPIRVLPAPDFPHPGGGILRLSGRTDGSGAFRLGAFAGTLQFAVQAPGLGFGATGRIEVIGGQVARPTIPPMARFARIEGRLAPTLAAPGTKVVLLSETFQRPVGPATPCDEQGRFSMVDVVPGVYRMAARRGGQDVPTAFREVRPEPGRVLAGVVLEPPPPPSPEDRKETVRMDRQLNGDRSRTITWVEGTIRDEQGRPLPGASVYVRVGYHGGIRMIEEVKKATADAQGRYRFEGPLHPSMGTLAVVASAKGRPPAIAYAPGPDASIEEAQLKPAHLDVALAPIGASASVTVLRDGRKWPGASVRLSARGAVAVTDGFLGWAAQGADRSEIDALFAPEARTGPDGVARFAGLFPGAFELEASTGTGPAPPRRGRRWARPEVPSAVVWGIAAPPGGKMEATVALHPQPGAVRFRILKPDGSPVVGQSVSLDFGRVQTSMSTSMDLDDRGIGAHDFESPGLWAVEIRFRDTELKSFPVHEEPFYQAEALIPVSPGLALEDPLTLRAVRRDRGAIRARLLGDDGRPARGTVVIDGDRGMLHMAGTVDAGGSVRFADLPSGKYRVRGVVDGREPAPRPRPGSNRFDDAALRGQMTVFDREQTLAPGEEASVDLRLEPVGYVRATIRAPAGRSPSDYAAFLDSDVPDDSPWGHEVDRKAGIYLFGPARPGRWSIVVRERTEDGRPYPKRGERPVVAEPGQVVRVDVEPDPGPDRPGSPRSRRQAFLGMGGISLLDSGPEGLAPTVLLHDGATPAFTARALFFPPGEREPTAEGIADASGRLTWTGRWRAQADGDEGGPEPPKAPTIAAWMPGLAGPVVAAVEPGKAIRLVLPATAGASGRVTLGGREIGGRNARVRVVAAAEGRDALAVAFGRATTADPDGRFRLPGLAPGRYRLQATRDDIWLSGSVPLVVEPGRDAAPIDLDIPEPGAPVALEFVDAGDRPIPDLSFAIRRPEGPLADELPITGRADDRGSAIVRGLEAGPQSLVADGDRRPHAFAVPPSRPGVAPAIVRIRIARPGP